MKKQSGSCHSHRTVFAAGVAVGQQNAASRREPQFETAK